MSHTKEKIVLVHGAFHNKDCWNLLIPELQKRGIISHTLTLVGHQSSNNNALSISLRDYVNQVVKMIQDIGESVMLLGHSMGGIIISMVAEQCPHLIRHLIYLTANVPRKKDRMIYMGKQMKSNDESIFLEALEYSFSALSKGRLSLNPDLSGQAFYSEQTPGIQKVWAQKIVNQPFRPYLGKIRWSKEKLQNITKSYIECELDKALTLSQQRFNQKNMTFNHVRTLKSDHSPFLLMPKELAETIFELSQLS